jgi:hypothetical protein
VRSGRGYFPFADALNRPRLLICGRPRFAYAFQSLAHSLRGCHQLAAAPNSWTLSTGRKGCSEWDESTLGSKSVEPMGICTSRGSRGRSPGRAAQQACAPQKTESGERTRFRWRRGPAFYICGIGVLHATVAGCDPRPVHVDLGLRTRRHRRGRASGPRVVVGCLSKLLGILCAMCTARQVLSHTAAHLVHAVWPLSTPQGRLWLN